MLIRVTDPTAPPGWCCLLLLHCMVGTIFFVFVFVFNATTPLTTTINPKLTGAERPPMGRAHIGGQGETATHGPTSADTEGDVVIGNSHSVVGPHNRRGATTLGGATIAPPSSRRSRKLAGSEEVV